MEEERAGDLPGGVAPGTAMEAALAGWLRVFYDDPPWRMDGKTHLCRFAGVVTASVATLCASETVLRTGGGARAAFLDRELARFTARQLRGAIQLAAAGGWVALKPYVHGGGIDCEVVGAGDFTPLRMRGQEVEDAVFFDHAKAGGRAYVRLETHTLTEGGVLITNRAMEAGSRQRPVPLETVPAWAGLYEEALVEGAARPLFTTLRMPFANCVEPGSALPVSLYAGAMDSLRELDRIYTEFLWEVKSGKRKQIIDITAALPLQGRGGQPRYAASEQYLVLDMGGNVDKPYDDYSPDMRVEAYREALNIQLRLLESQCQLSSGTFSFDPRTGHAQTATEVVSGDHTTYNTVKAIQESGLRQGLMDLAGIYDLYATLYRLAPAGVIEAGVEFGDSVFEDTATEFERRKSLADGGYIRPEYLTSWYFGVGLEEAIKMGSSKRGT